MSEIIKAEDCKKIVFWFEPTSITLNFSCLCGTTEQFHCHTVEGAQGAVMDFIYFHSGEGHGYCDAKTAAKIRRNFNKGQVVKMPELDDRVWAEFPEEKHA